MGATLALALAVPAAAQAPAKYPPQQSPRAIRGFVNYDKLPDGPYVNEHGVRIVIAKGRIAKVRGAAVGKTVVSRDGKITLIGRNNRVIGLPNGRYSGPGGKLLVIDNGKLVDKASPVLFGD